MRASVLAINVGGACRYNLLLIHSLASKLARLKTALEIYIPISSTQLMNSYHSFSQINILVKEILAQHQPYILVNPVSRAFKIDFYIKDIFGPLKNVLRYKTEMDTQSMKNGCLYYQARDNLFLFLFLVLIIFTHCIPFGWGTKQYGKKCLTNH